MGKHYYGSNKEAIIGLEVIRGGSHVQFGSHNKRSEALRRSLTLPRHQYLIEGQKNKLSNIRKESGNR